ncbi:NAD(P)-dependent oxidoreductase [Actinomadura harenae]|uniref:SDR family oxidoreductase n=1 Tax=Actinomadura harenae TaxID=2483351 RepID=A0A3M2LYE9_9ACTN|nr:SDR family oxidoreductase [Actinomadura harenae]RMI42544.1 SDR family oxidoreductase [Actinomadura harenae]
MRITIFGATGGIGTAACREAAERGHEVTAVVRDAARLPADVRERVNVVVADVMDPAAVQSAVEGRDAVLSCLGSRGGRAATTVLTDAATSVVKGMRAAGARRLLTVSAAAPYPDPGDGFLGGRVFKPLVSKILERPFADLLRADDLVEKADGIDWTLVRPPMLQNGPATGTYRLGLDLAPPKARRIRRADVAAAMLDLAGDPTSIGHVAWVAA